LDRSHFPPGFKQNAVYNYVDKPQGRCLTYLKEEETIAVSSDIFGSPGFSCGDQYYIDLNRDGQGKVFTITDSGTFREHKQFDIYSGEQYHDAFYANHPHTGEKFRVAKVQP
jgi:hypothetical protein